MCRILIVYSRRPPILEDLGAAFRELGHSVDYFFADKNTFFDRHVIRRSNWWAHRLRLIPKRRFLFQGHPLSHFQWRSSNLIRAVNEYNPDVTIVIRGINFSDKALAYAASRSKLIGWWVEKEERVQEALCQLNFFHHYFFMNSSCVQNARAAGFRNVSYLGHSVNIDRFHPVMGAAKKYDVCFVGNWSAKRQNIIQEVSKKTKNLVIYGSKWRVKNLSNPTIFRAVKGKYIDGPALNALYNASRIVLNVTNWGFGEGALRSGMNMRVLEVPASGAFMLTDESIDMKPVLQAGVHIGTYQSLEECLAKIDCYLGDESLREQVASDGSRWVRSQYGYQSIARQMLNVSGVISVSSPN